LVLIVAIQHCSSRFVSSQSARLGAVVDLGLSTRCICHIALIVVLRKPPTGWSGHFPELIELIFSQKQFSYMSRRYCVTFQNASR